VVVGWFLRRSQAGNSGEHSGRRLAVEPVEVVVVAGFGLPLVGSDDAGREQGAPGIDEGGELVGGAQYGGCRGVLLEQLVGLFLRGRFDILQVDLCVGSVWRSFCGFAVDSDHSMA
jgi:hypothetical protein